MHRMAEQRERKLHGDPEQDELMPVGAEDERIETGETAPESPEQKREREYRENAARLLARATQYIEEQRKEKLPPVLPMSQELFESTPLPTLDTAREQWQKSRGRFSALKETPKRFKMRSAGVENPDDLMALTHYLEQNLTNEEHHYIRVKASKKDREIEKYERKGHEVHDVHDSYRKKAQIQFTIQK